MEIGPLTSIRIIDVFKGTTMKKTLLAIITSALAFSANAAVANTTITAEQAVTVETAQFTLVAQDYLTEQLTSQVKLDFTVVNQLTAKNVLTADGKHIQLGQELSLNTLVEAE